MHVALVGMTGSGKSEDTYCRQDTVAGQPLMVWMMDTVDDASRDEMRWLAWADVYLVVYDVTSQLSLQYVEFYKFMVHFIEIYVNLLSQGRSFRAWDAF
ncbi:unnamed protein product [Haemonchus placei]|uniref:small monomeric GTPase n=1 Tax=Haemonchus placei TaxID=6290 RepID=A0A0N4WIG6_HAEPC|nr:unnamed protein product [Haemonchus placei]